MNKKVINELNHINIDKYLREYIGITNEELIYVLANMTHKEFKEVCDRFAIADLTRVSFDTITMEEIQTGEILLVSDKASNLAPYLNPIQNKLDRIMADSYDKNNSILYETDEEYIDTLEEIVSDINISNTVIKHLSYNKTINRKGDSND